MDKKQSNYIYLLAISVIIYLLLIQIELIDGLIAAAFFISSLYLVFTREEKVEFKEELKIPEAHIYQNSRLNIYGFAMAGSFVVASIIFYFLSFNTNLRIGIISLVLWTLLAIVSYAIGKLSDKSLFEDMIINYLHELFPRVSIADLMAFLRIMNNNSELESDRILRKLKSVDLNKDVKLELINAYLNYLGAVSNDVSSEEITETNKKYKDKNI